MIFKLFPLLMGLTGLVVTTSCYLKLMKKIDDVAPVVLVLVPISIDTKEGDSYLKFGKIVW
jgi:hypothetical protein